MGPLDGLKIIELAGIGPGPFAAMMLGDMGADVIRIDRIGGSGIVRYKDKRHNVHGRSRRSLALDLRKPEAVEIVLRLAEQADGLIEPFRPGVAERLGLGPGIVRDRNPRLVYGRMTGWGQDGPLSRAAGHDINYIALSGALHAIGPASRPSIPLNLVGDFGGGSMLLAFGMLCALFERQRSGEGQVVDAAIVDGTAAMFGAFMGMHATGMWRAERESNLLDGHAPFYGVYETRDGKFVSIGSIEPQFYGQLLNAIGLAEENVALQMDRDAWPRMRERFEAKFREKTREEWCALMEGTDICFAPVLSLEEAPGHHHARARNGYIDIEGFTQPSPAPRFSRTPGHAFVAPRPGEHGDDVLREAGLDEDIIGRLREAKVIG